MTSLLKSTQERERQLLLILERFERKKCITLMPRTCASAFPSWAIESLKVHSSLVHTELNAAGKNASTTGLPCTD